MTHSHKHPKSRFQYFRFDVPKPLQALAGTTTWRFSLRTTDPAVAAIARAKWTAHYTGEVIRLRGILAASVRTDVCADVDRALDVIAASNGSRDAVVRAILRFIVLRARESWSRSHEREAQWDFGLVFYMDEEACFLESDKSDPFPGFDTEEERQAFVTRQRLIENRGFADGITLQEVARHLLERQAWGYIAFDVDCVLARVGRTVKEGTPEFEAAAEHLLRRLAEHQFEDWQPGFRSAVAPLAVSGAQSPAQAVQTPPSAATLPSPPLSWPNAGARSDSSQTLTTGLGHWIAVMAPGKSAITEATRAVERFTDLYGDRHVASISANDIYDYRDFLEAMPKGLSLPDIKAAGMSLRQAVERAHAQEQQEREDALKAGKPAPPLKRLSPTSVKKDIGGLSAIFSALKSERWIEKNLASGVRVKGYSKEKKVFPFRPQMMKKLFDSPMFTGCKGLRGKQRTQPGAHVFQDTLYWSFLFGVTSGHRMSEIAQAPIEDVEETVGPSGETIVGIFILDAKNDASQRVIIVHPHLLSLGFLDFVKERKRLGKAQLFDLPAGGSKKLSERLNEYIDAVVVDDRRFVFHSLRHEFADRSEIDVGVEVSKKIMGHARGRLYGLGAPLHHAAAELNKIDMSFVDWDRLRAAAGRPTASAA